MEKEGQALPFFVYNRKVPVVSRDNFVVLGFAFSINSKSNDENKWFKGIIKFVHFFLKTKDFLINFTRLLRQLIKTALFVCTW